jgi:hypothetical protein
MFRLFLISLFLVLAGCDISTTEGFVHSAQDCFVGDIYIETQAHLDALKSYRCIDGSVTIDASVESLELPNLVEVTGDFIYGSHVLGVGFVADFDLGELTKVGGNLNLNLSVYSDSYIDLSDLAYVGKGFDLFINSSATFVNLDKLERVGGSLEIITYSITEGSKIMGFAEIMASSLTYVRFLSISEEFNWFVGYSWLSSLTQVQDLFVGYTELTDLSFLSNISSCSNLMIVENDYLPYCDICEFLSQFDYLSLLITGNDNDACGTDATINCP